MENPFKNLVINLHASGPAAVIIVWIAAVTALGLYGTGELAKGALGTLQVARGMILISLAAQSR
jgi:hypothetical protein